jgi:Beta-galactosidase
MTENRRRGVAKRLRTLLRLVVSLGTWVAASAGQQPTEAEQVQAAASSAEPRLPAVRLDGNYFSRDGHRFNPVGANWVPAKAGMQWPTQWDPKAIEADFARMHELGFNTIRLDFVWAWIEPRPGDYNPEAFRALDFLISLLLWRMMPMPLLLEKPVGARASTKKD